MFVLDVVLVDDHSVVRKGLTSLIRELGWNIVAEAPTLKDASSIIDGGPWSLMVLDLNLPDGDGIEFIHKLRMKGFRQPILAHSLMPDSAVADRVFKAGGSGYISKACDTEDFLAACRKLASGGRYVSPEYAEQLAMDKASDATSNLHENLSTRERQVMLLIAQGRAPTEIALEIDCNVNTISTYRARILKKLGLTKSADIIRYAMTHHLT